MTCSTCGTENEPGRKFCKECGTRLAVACPTCGAFSGADVKFCGECGTALETSAPASRVVPTPTPAEVAPVAERRVVSILFADLVGFTALVEGHDAEETRELLSRYFELSRDVIARYGGTVEKFIGDAVMAVWGAPTAHEDDAERSVRAALELVDAVKALGPQIQARAGVLTGEAAVTIGATNQGMVAGDLVNTASRLQSVAAPGTVLVGEATQRAASKAIAFEEAGEQHLKGKTSPVPAWRALRVVAEVGGRNRAETLEAPFVGRDDELRLLKDLFHSTSRDARARLVSVIGPAGIGKTRLAWELSKYLDGLVDTVWFHDGRSPAYGAGISFWALGEMVRRRAGLLEIDDGPTTRSKIAATLAEHVPDPGERRWIEPALLALLGVETAIGGSEQLFAAWRTFFERLASTAPVVLVFEDFHFADVGLIDFVDHVLEWSRNFPIYVVTLSRPELLEKRPDWGAGKRNFTSLYLEPLSTAAMRELMAGLVPGLPPAAIRAIVERADGMPLYAVETVRMLLAEGKLAVKDGRYIPVGDLANLAVPETLTALIASRLDGLGAEDRILVSDAAVLGQSFTLAGLSAVSGIAESELEPRLIGLVRRELLTRETDPRSPEHGQYAFVQALIREVAYNTLAKRDRKVRHLAAARFFESLGSDEIAGGLAGHYLAAHANAPKGPEADALAGQARIALRAAGERAAALGGPGQALTFFEQALTVTSDPAETADLLEQAGEVATTAGHYEISEVHLRRAIGSRRELGDRRAIARATAGLARTLTANRRTSEALALLEPAVDEFADLADDPEGIVLGHRLAGAYQLAGAPRRSIEVADRSLEAAERANLVALVAQGLVTKGTSLANLGRTTEALGLIATGQNVAEAGGLDRTVLVAMINRSAIEWTRDPRAALSTARAALALAKRLGVRSSAVISLGNGVLAARRTGDWSWADAELTAALAEEAETSDRLFLLEAKVSLQSLRGESVDEAIAEMVVLAGPSTDSDIITSLQLAAADEAFASGRLVDARDAWHQAADLAAEYRPALLARAGRAALWIGDIPGAREDLAALDAAGVHGPAIEADRLTIRAGVATFGGRSGDALSLHREALQVWRELGLPWDEALCGLDMALLLDPTDPEVTAAADSAREIFARLGAKPFLAQLEEALVRPRSAARATRGLSGTVTTATAANA